MAPWAKTDGGDAAAQDGSATVGPQHDSDDDSLVILLTGDVLLDRDVRPLAERHGAAWLFDPVGPTLRVADAVVINLECPLSDTPTPLAGPYIFRGETRWADDLRAAGVTHATLANNHSKDQGFQGLRSTVQALHQAGITPLGIGHDKAERLTPVVVSKGRRRVALFAAVTFTLENWLPPADGRISPTIADASTLAEAIRSHRASHPRDAIIAVLHWGHEFDTVPTVGQRQTALRLIEAGADAIVGHHPHVRQPASVHHGRPVLYSLGNFVFDLPQPEARRGAIARLVATADTLTLSELPIDIIGCRPHLRMASPDHPGHHQ